jgi:hypothetical protein
LLVYLSALFPTSYIILFFGVRHPQHTQTSSNYSTTAADCSNGVTNIRCCRYSCTHS